MERKCLKEGDIIRNILNINTKIEPYSLEYTNVACETNTIELCLNVSNITNPYLEITKVDGGIVNTDILTIEDSFINYAIPFNYFSIEGTMSVRLRSDESDGQYINFQIVDNFTSKDNLIVKTENGIYKVKPTSLNTYSTNEKKIGTWIDGKAIYRKVIKFGTLPNNSIKEVAHGISNLDYVISLSGTATDGNTCIILPRTHTASTLNIVFEINKTNIIAYDEYDFSSYSAYAIVEYTKTTEEG